MEIEDTAPTPLRRFERLEMDGAVWTTVRVRELHVGDTFRVEDIPHAVCSITAPPALIGNVWTIQARVVYSHRGEKEDSVGPC